METIDKEVLDHLYKIVNRINEKDPKFIPMSVKETLRLYDEVEEYMASGQRVPIHLLYEIFIQLKTSILEAYTMSTLDFTKLGLTTETYH